MAPLSWKVRFYSTPAGDSPVEKFVDSLDEKAQAKIINTIRLLKDYNIRLGPPHAKKLSSTDLWELRILGGDSLRIIYIAVQDKTFLLLHGIKKKTQKTPVNEVKVALERLREYRSRK